MKILCGGCNKRPAAIHPTYGPTWCKSCINTKSESFKGQSYPEMTIDSIRDSRKQYFKSATQPFRGGSISREYIEAYPKSVKNMIKEGSVTKDEVKKAKYVWKDLPGWGNREKSL